tara:strand:+ start:237 stop:713 length:477 start_codon:yes stop_codon:yes gene_type:complete
MNSLIMLKMALKQLKDYSSNEWVIEGGKKYNIDTVLSQIKVAEKNFINFKGRPSDCSFKLYDDCEDETYSQKMQEELEPIDEPTYSKLKLHEELGVMSSGYYECYPNNLPRLIEGIEDKSSDRTIDGGVITHIGGVPVDWSFHVTDDDLEFQEGDSDV